MPVITVRFIKDVVATPEQKRELIVKLTDTFVGVLGDVVRPFTYCIIEETPVGEWGIAGVPMPDLEYLVSPKHAQVIERSNDLMRAAIAQMNAGQGGSSSSSYTPFNPDGSVNHEEYFAEWFDELWNKKNYDIAFKRVHPNFTAHGAGGQDIKQGPDGVSAMVREWHKAFPDAHMTMDEVITEGDLSTIRMTFTGTHLGEFYGMKPSGKQVKITSIGIDRVVDGMITEGWGELDMFGMMQQMGIIPSPSS
jgi:4-oxalocrotonate tautomerase